MKKLFALLLAAVMMLGMMSFASADDMTLSARIPYDKGLLMRMVHERCQVVHEEYEQGGLLVTVRASRRMAETLAPYVCA